MMYYLRWCNSFTCTHADRAVRDAIMYDGLQQYSEIDFLYKSIELAINSGATIINIPDTVGYTLPIEYGNIFKNVKNNVSNIDKAILSAHTHNDLGLAVANSLSAIKEGARYHAPDFCTLY